MDLVLRRMVRRLAHRAPRRFGKNLSGSEMYINKFKHPGVPLSFPGADQSLKLFDFISLHRGERPAGGSLEQNKKEDEEEND